MMKNYQFQDFRQATFDDYDQIIGLIPKTEIYIHKSGYPNIIVKAVNVQERLHCWQLSHIVITQQQNLQKFINNRVKIKNRSSIKFPGQLIFTLIRIFNQRICAQILQQVQYHTKQLEQWCQSPITDLFIVQQKIESKLGFTQGYIQIKSFMKRQYYPMYYEYRRWQSDIQSTISIIQKGQRNKGVGQNHYDIFEQVLKKRKPIKLKEKKQKAIE